MKLMSFVGKHKSTILKVGGIVLTAAGIFVGGKKIKNRGVIGEAYEADLSEVEVATEVSVEVEE